MEGQETPAVMTVAQAAEFAGVSTKTIYRAIEDGRLTAASLGRSTALRTTPAWIKEWIEGSRYKPQATPTKKARPNRRPRPSKPQMRGYLEA